MAAIEDISPVQPIPGFSARFAHSESMTFAFWQIEEGAMLPEHSHVHEQVMHVLEGTFELTIDGASKVFGPGELCAIPSNAVHSGTALTPCRVLDTFSPSREDYRIPESCVL